VILNAQYCTLAHANGKVMLYMLRIIVSCSNIIYTITCRIMLDIVVYLDSRFQPSVIIIQVR